MSGAAEEGTFRIRTVAWLVAVGVIGFVAMLVLGAYAPDLRSGHDGGGHALSNAAIGYSGLVQLAEATGRHPRIIRDARQFGSDDLLVITPQDPGKDVSAAVGRPGHPLLVVLPKWLTSNERTHAGWVRAEMLAPPFVAEGVLAPATLLHVAQRRSGGRPLVVAPELGPDVRFRAPRPLQVLTGSTLLRRKGAPSGTPWSGRLHPLISDGRGGAVLAQLDGGPTYILADPDLLDNRAMADPATAAAALAMLDWLQPRDPDHLNFDVTLNGFGRTRSPLKLAFEPPFLALTLTVAAAMLLAGLHAAGRFGAPVPRARAIAFGTAALVNNAAALVRRAGREGRMGARYADVARERARARFAVRGRDVDAALDKMGPRRFTDLAAAAGAADDAGGVLAAAQALSDWGRRA